MRETRIRKQIAADALRTEREISKSLAGLAGLVLVFVLQTTLIAAAVAPQRGDLAEEVQLMSELLELEPGYRVADVGADDGLYASRFAPLVGSEGHVFASEISDRQVDEIRATARDRGLQNLTAIRATNTESGLPAGCCDGIMLRVVFHHLAEPAAMLAQFYAALEPGGTPPDRREPAELGPQRAGGPGEPWRHGYRPRHRPGRDHRGRIRTRSRARGLALRPVRRPLRAAFPSSRFLTSSGRRAASVPAICPFRVIQSAARVTEACRLAARHGVMATRVMAAGGTS